MFKRKTDDSLRSATERRAGDYAVELMAIEDPYFTDRAGHETPEYQAGLERLLSFDLRVRNLSRSEDQSVCTGWFHLHDSEGYTHASLGLDGRNKGPRFQETCLEPGATARGWLTFALPRDRQPDRLVFFSGYLAGKTAVFKLPRRTPEEWEAHYEEARRAWADRRVARELAIRDARLREHELRAAALARRGDSLRELDRREAALEAAGNGSGRSRRELPVPA